MENIQFKVLSINDIDKMRAVIEDDNMIFNSEQIESFMKNDTTVAIGAIVDDKIIGLAYGYNLERLNGKNMFYLHSVGLLPDYQNQGIGSKLMKYVSNWAKENGYSEMFVITERSNPRACKVYSGAGGISEHDDEVVFVFDYEK
ncbi:GNAT family N-acetyltransferase [Candidatus Saccharibacteria bacterium]|nr:GNAT family N-acetyltransferase [Candidatus Saccharibacteria bacterium]